MNGPVAGIRRSSPADDSQSGRNQENAQADACDAHRATQAPVGRQKSPGQNTQAHRHERHSGREPQPHHRCDPILRVEDSEYTSPSSGHWPEEFKRRVQYQRRTGEHESCAECHVPVALRAHQPAACRQHRGAHDQMIRGHHGIRSVRTAAGVSSARAAGQGEFILAEKFCRNNGLGPVLDFPGRMR